MICTGFAIGFVYLTCTAPALAPPPAARFCKVSSLFKYSRHDTAETRRQLRAANAKFRAACGDR